MHGKPAFLSTLIAGILLASAVGCSPGTSAPQQSSAPKEPPALRPTALPPAAEPARAPKRTEEPVGKVVKVGPVPEGISADPETHIVAVGLRGTKALALVDGGTGETLRTVPLPGRSRHLEVADPGGPVLIPVEGANALVKVSLPAGEKLAQIQTGLFPHAATESPNGTVFVANELGSTVVALRGGEIVKTFTEGTQPAGLAAVGNTVAMVDARQNDLTFYDAEALRRTGSLPAGEGPTHVVSSPDGLLAVTDTRGDAVLFYQLEPKPHQVGTVELAGSPYGIAYDDAAGLVWVTLTAKNQVVAIDPNGGEPQVVERLPTVRQPNSVAVDDVTGRVFVTGTAKGTLQLIDP